MFLANSSIAKPNAKNLGDAQCGQPCSSRSSVLILPDLAREGCVCLFSVMCDLSRPASEVVSRNLAEHELYLICVHSSTHVSTCTLAICILKRLATPVSTRGPYYCQYCTMQVELAHGETHSPDEFSDQFRPAACTYAHNAEGIRLRRVETGLAVSARQDPQRNPAASNPPQQPQCARLPYRWTVERVVLLKMQPDICQLGLSRQAGHIEI